MKKYILTLLVALLGIASAGAQQDDGMKGMRTFYFYYVAHDNTTPVDDLINRIYQDYNSVMENEAAAYPMIIYLSSDDRPVIVKINLPGANPDDYDNRFVQELYMRDSHVVNPNKDVATIMQLFNDAGMLNSDGTVAYGKAMLNFFVTPRFWTSGQNEELIANLFFAMDLDKAMEDGDKLDISIYHPTASPLNQNVEAPFGRKNLGNINHYLSQKFFPM